MIKMIIFISDDSKTGYGSKSGAGSWRNDHYYDFADMDPDDYTSEEDYMEAVEIKYGWRDYCYGIDYDINHGDNDIMDKYLEAINIGEGWQYACCLNVL